MKTYTKLLAFFLAVALTSSAKADLITYEFTGFITEINVNENDVIPGLDVGDEFSGFTTFDSSGFSGTEGTVFVELNGVDLLFDGPSIFGDVEVVTDNFYSIRIAADTGGDIGESTFSAFNFGPDLEDSDGSAGHNEPFPNSLNLLEFEQNIFRIGGNYLPTGDDISITGQLNSFSASAVPEPSSLLILGASLFPFLRRNRS